MATVPQAAHVGHHIAHTYADLGAFIGGAVGLLAGAAIVYFGGPMAIGVAADVVGIGMAAGEAIAGLFGRDEESGVIARGSPNVHYGGQLAKAARMDDRTACHSPGMAIAETLSFLNPITSIITAARSIDRSITVIGMHVSGEEILASDLGPGAHAGSKIADGSSTVFINTLPAARKEDGVAPCDGKISQGIETILIGGEQCHAPDTEDRNEVSRGQRVLFDAIDLIGGLAGGPRDPGAWARAAEFLGEQLGIPWLESAGRWGGIVTGVRGARASRDALETGVVIVNAPGDVGGALDATGRAMGSRPPPRRVFDRRTRTVRTVP